MSESPLTFSVKINVQTVGDPAEYLGKPYYRLRFVASEPDNMSEKIFVHQQQGSKAVFRHVAGPLDLVRLTETSDAVTGYFLADTADILMYSATDAEQARQAIIRATKFLVNGLHRLQQLETVEEIVISSGNE